MEQSDSGIPLHAVANVVASCALSGPTASEFESLKQALLDKEEQLLLMENTCLRESERQAELEDSVIAWQDKYDRLYESHKRVQKINQSLEDKLLKMVDRNTAERAQLTSDVATLSVRLAQANFNIAKLQREIERYKADINLAIQLLQCNPDSFMPQKISSLPMDVQSKVSAYMRLETNSHSDSEGSGVGVATSASYKVLPASESPPPAPCPFPPTAMVYSMRGLDAKNNTTTNQGKQQQDIDNSKEILSNSNSTCNNNNNLNNNNKVNITNINISNNNHTNYSHNNNSNNINNNNNNTNNNSNRDSNSNNNIENTLNSSPDTISPLIMAKFLEHELKAEEIKHCDTCQCSKRDLTVLADVSRFYTVATQTPLPLQTNNQNLNDSLGGQVCMRCHSNLNSPSRTNSPFFMKMVKSSDSVISETKSSVSDLNDVDKLFTPPPKKDDLMVNPILGHHRLCDRTADRTSGSTASTLIPGSGIHANPSMGFDSTIPKGNSGATMLYPTTHLGTYEAEKYLLETNTLASVREHLRGNGMNIKGGTYQRRFLDGGGSALCLLGSNGEPPKKQSIQDNNNQYDGIADEEKPLLCEDSVVLQRGSATKRNIASLDVLQDAIKSPASTCSANDVHKILAKSAITSSMNSLWSKGSNCESSKVFENFNRNLIRTIKSENPRYRGPRLCAMRIQRTENGQSNILLNNIESLETVTPVIYRRRERLLDEELDDTKDVITSGSPIVRKVALKALSSNDQVGSEAFQETSLPETYRHIYVSDTANDWSNDVNTQDLDGTYTADCAQQNATQRDCEVETAIPDKLILNCKADSKTGENPNDSLRKNTTVPIADLKTISHSMPGSKQTSSSYEIVRNDSSSKNSINSKSCTQSSSTNEAINFQESVILRRQQLSRVAEWVQSNTQQLEQQQNIEKTSPTTPQCDSSGTDRQSSFSTLDQLDSVSIEKLSMDSGYKTTPQPQTNGFVEEKRKDDSNTHQSAETSLSPKMDTESNSPSRTAPYSGILNKSNSQPASNSTAPNKYHFTTLRSGLSITTANAAFNSCQMDTNGDGIVPQIEDLNVPMLPEQPTCDILNYKYYPCERDKSRAIDAELHMTTTNVDIAQMEYNVKQFLLKQNEWSMRANGCGGNSTTNTAAATAAAVASVITATSQRPKGIRRSKLFSSVGIGPGVGERIRTELPTSMHASSNCGIIRDVSNIMSTPTTLQTAIPQRTETNL